MITAMQFFHTTIFTFSVTLLISFTWCTQATPSAHEKILYTQQGNMTGDINKSQYDYNPLNQVITNKTQHNILSYQYYANGLQANECINPQKILYSYYADKKYLLNRIQNEAFSGYLISNHHALVRYHTSIHQKLTQIFINNRHQSVILALQHNYITPQQYTAYGIAILHHEGSNTPFAYSHYLADQAAKMDYLKARFYLPHIRTFLTRDSKNLNNRYQYANDNPIMNIDPSGHMTEALFNQMEAILQTTDHTLNAEIRVVNSFNQHDTFLRRDRFNMLKEAAEKKWINTDGQHTTIISAHGNEETLAFAMKPHVSKNDLTMLSQKLKAEGFYAKRYYYIDQKAHLFEFNRAKLLQEYLEHKLGPTECLIFDVCDMGITEKFFSLRWQSGPTLIITSPLDTSGIYSLLDFSVRHAFEHDPRLNPDLADEASAWRSSKDGIVTKKPPLTWNNPLP